MKRLKIFACPDCNFRARELKELNNHIAATKCNKGEKISKLRILIQANILKEDTFDVNLQTPVSLTI